MRHRIRHIAVLVPARDEELLLPRCLRSVLAAIGHAPLPVTTDIVVVSDGSEDRTFELATELLRGTGTAVLSAAACVGSARRTAAEVALQRYAGESGAVWLANTDADCAVPANWLLDQLAAAEAGCCAVAGIVDVDSFAEHDAGVARRFRETYLVHPDGTHPHVHGANLGMRADAYLRAGGWGALPTAEDHDLWRRLQHTGAATVADAGLRVVTSGRRVARAPGGFADALAAHNLRDEVHSDRHRDRHPDQHSDRHRDRHSDVPA